MIPLDVIQPQQLDHGNTTTPLSEFGVRFLAEGDSWFSLGSLNPLASANLLQSMAFTQRCIAVNCALPSDTLRRMVDARRDPQFVSLLAGARARPWDALLLSAGGNDLVDALQTPSRDRADQPIATARRLLLTADEWGSTARGAARYLSDAGWATFSNYLCANFDALLALRDRGPSRGRPLFMHGYAIPTPRPSGAGGGSGPWLLPALLDYAIPCEDWPALARLLIERLAALLSSLAADAERFPALHFFDSTRLPIVPAASDAQGDSGDWLNEIHLNRSGCRKLARAWSEVIESAL